MKKKFNLFLCAVASMFLLIVGVNAQDVTTESELKTCLEAGSTCVIKNNINITSVIVAADDAVVDLNGFTLKGNVANVIIDVNSGNYYTGDDYLIVGGAGAPYYSTNAKVLVKTNGDLTIKSGDVTLGSSMCTMPGQVITIEKNATFTIPEGKELQLYSLLKVEGKLIIKGQLKQITTKEGGSLKTSNPAAYNSSAESNAAVVGDFTLDGGTYLTWDPVYNYTPIAGKDAAYASDYAVINLDDKLNITIKKGDLSLGFDMNTMANQTITFEEGTSFLIPASKKLNINDTTKIDIKGTFEVSDIAYLSKINLIDNGLMILNKDDSLKNVVDAAGDEYCIYELTVGKKFAIASEHSSTILMNKVEATVDDEGYTGDLVCSKCGKVIKAGEKIPKLEKEPEKVEDEKAPEKVEDEKTPETFDSIKLTVGISLLALTSGLCLYTYLKKNNI